MSDILDAPHEYLGLLEPRRVFKTSTLFAKALGRIANRMDYMVAYTMATFGVNARKRFRDDIVKPLEFLYPDKKDRPFQIVKSGGGERIEWFETQSVFAFLGPKGDSFRSDAWDWIIIDEAGEASPEMGVDLLDGAVATQDTRPEAHFTITGTGPRYREGNLLWDELEAGRAGLKGHAILDYSADQDTRLSDVDTWEKAKPLILDVHPNMPDFITVDRMESNYVKAGAKGFLREYLGVAEHVAGDSFIDPLKWLATRSEIPAENVKPPAHFSLVIVAHPEKDLCAAIVAAWRDESGKAHGLVMDHRQSTSWLATEALKAARAVRKPIVYDNKGPVLVEVEVLERARPKPKLAPQTWRDVQTAHALLYKEIENGKVVTYGQQPMDDAAARVVRRSSGGSWAFGRAAVDDDIICLEGFALALRYFDANPAGSGYLPPEARKAA